MASASRGPSLVMAEPINVRDRGRALHRTVVHQAGRFPNQRFGDNKRHHKPEFWGFMDQTACLTERSTGLFLCHEPPVKSGRSTALERFATETSDNRPTAVHDAPS